MACIVYVANTNVIELTGLTDAVDNTLISDAAVSFTIKDADGAEVAGQTWPAPMDAVGGTDGVPGLYRGIIEDDVEMVAGTLYVAHVEVDAGPDRVGHWEFAFTPKTRRGS
jgi:hypothetical protein